MTNLKATQSRELSRTLLCPGKKWKLSPYLDEILKTAKNQDLVDLVPVYQSVFLDLLQKGKIARTFDFMDIGSPRGIGVIAFFDAWLAWQTACAVHSIENDMSLVTPRLDTPDITSARRLYQHYHQTIYARTTSIPELSSILTPQSWPQQPESVVGPRTQVVVCAQPWRHEAKLRRLMVELPDDAYIIGINWRGSGDKGSVFRWRYELLSSVQGWVASGPCGQEYGSHLPEVCKSCFHGRVERMHDASQSTEPQQVRVWNYALMKKTDEAVVGLAAEGEPVEALRDRVLRDLNLRYLGTVRKRKITADHPDDAEDNPTDEIWREYLTFCPGNSGSRHLVVERRAGMQIPFLTYGQWLHLRQVKWHSKYQGDVLIVPDETAFHTPAAHDTDTTYLPAYSSRVRTAIDEAAYRLFGFQSMRPFQHTILERALCGHDIFAIAATGGGKSECYILASMLLPGITVVISPLKSLIQDQYEQRIRDRFGLDFRATFIDGDVPFFERQGRLRRMVLGHYKLVYMTPEQLERGYVLDFLRQADEGVGVRYLAMDEAHCISQWGHDFRPAYLNIVQRLEAYGLHPTRIALTATASPLVRDDVCQELHLDNHPIDRGGDVFVDSSNRPELNLVVHRAQSSLEKARFITEQLRNLDEGAALIFMPHTGGPINKPRDFGAPQQAPRPRYAGMVSPGVTPFSRYLRRELGREVAIYHGSLADESQSEDDDDIDFTGTVTRQEQQRQFMSGKRNIMVATKGFGMGVDKPDIRLVIHRSPPGNLEAYAQESGRAGRDGKPATAILLYSKDQPEIVDVIPDTYVGRTSLPSDRDIQQFFIEQRYVRRADVRAMLSFLRNGPASRVNKTLYFTNDQVQNYFEALVDYDWPLFQPREFRGSRDHVAILERGCQYNQKSAHVGRILSVLFNNRPTLDGKLLPAVRAVHETGTLMRSFRLHNASRILQLPTYFSDILREAGIDARELQCLLPHGRLVEITPLAERLDLSLRETNSMLRDIRYCEGRTDRQGHWVGTLLNFWWIEAPRHVNIPDPYRDLDAWRAYAGARTRVRPKGDRRGLDNYFPWSVVNHPTGWEVEPDAGLSFEPADRYLDAFMSLHDQRKQNDWSNFGYLVDRYIGADGKPQQCLRSLLLGYLKTNEVILDGNCHSCSVCVPDLNFDRYSIEDRRQVVVRLMQSTTEQFDRLETAARSMPDPELLDAVLDAVEAEDRTGRSGRAYLDSWLARVIQDDPQHQGALWMRIRCYEKQVLSLSPGDVVNALERLWQATSRTEIIAQIKQTVEMCQSDLSFRSYEVQLLTLAAQIAGAREEWKTEAGLWQQVLESGSVAGKDRCRILSRLLELYRDRLESRPQAVQVAQELLNTPGISEEDTKAAYEYLVSTWSQRDFLTFLRQHGQFRPEVGVLAWLDGADDSKKAEAIAWLECYGNQILGASSALWRDVEARLRPEIGGAPKLLLTIANSLKAVPGEQRAVAHLVLEAWSSGAKLSRAQFVMLNTGIGLLDQTWCRERIAVRDEAASFFEGMLEAFGDASPPSEWIDLFPKTVMNDLSQDWLSRVLEAIVQDSSANGISPNADVLLARADDLKLVVFVEFAKHTIARRPALALHWFSLLTPDSPSQQTMADMFFDRAMQPGISPSRSAKYLNQLIPIQAKLDSGSRKSVCLNAWQSLADERVIWPDLLCDHIEGHVLVGLMKHWVAIKRDSYHLDLLVVILRDVQRRTPRTWLTPISLEFQVLCTAGRFAEASAILERKPDIQIPGTEARTYLTAQKKLRPPRETVFEEELERLWELAKTGLF